MWVYVQLNGHLIAADGSLAAIGYAGHSEGKNNPAMQEVKDIGPLPCGGYTMQPPVDTELHGPYVLWLVPDVSNLMFGREGFGIHGDSLVRPGDASDGCIVLNREVRMLMWGSGDVRLRVVSGLSDDPNV